MYRMDIVSDNRRNRISAKSPACPTSCSKNLPRRKSRFAHRDL